MPRFDRTGPWHGTGPRTGFMRGGCASNFPGGKKHYHVIGGLHGCMPNFNYYAETRKDAEQIAKSEVKSMREDGAKAWGSARSGYYEIKSNFGIEYVEISDCYENCSADDY